MASRVETRDKRVACEIKTNAKNIRKNFFVKISKNYSIFTSTHIFVNTTLIFVNTILIFVNKTPAKIYLVKLAYQT